MIRSKEAEATIFLVEAHMQRAICRDEKAKHVHYGAYLQHATDCLHLLTAGPHLPPEERGKLILKRREPILMWNFIHFLLFFFLKSLDVPLFAAP